MKASNPIASLLGKSPFKPIQAHMEIIIECVNEVPGLFDALIDGNHDELIKHKDRIFSKEYEADVLMHDLHIQLPKSLFMPVDRRDLLGLLDMQDEIANIAQDIAGLMTERDMSVPKGMEKQLKEFVQRCIDTCAQAETIIQELDELIEMGFRGREASKVDEMVEKLSQIEDETDEMGMALTRTLFSMEDEMKPVSVIFWYQMIQWIGDLADYAEKVGDRMRLLIAK